MAEIIDGKQIATDLRNRIAHLTKEFIANHQINPHLVVVLVGEDPASQVYVRNKERACQKAGISSTVHRLSAETSQQELLDLITSLNEDTQVHGILVQLPLPTQIDEQVILDSISPLKDVDAFHPENVGRIVQGRPRFLPCTPAGCLQLIQSVETNLSGMHAVILGRSEIVGKPMANMLIQRGVDCTVTTCHSRTKDLAEISRQADILIAAIGQPEFVTGEMISAETIVIDVGINRVEGKLVGDVNFPQVSVISRAITPVPGGVGPMTIANLLQNTLTAAELQVVS